MKPHITSGGVPRLLEGPSRVLYGPCVLQLLCAGCWRACVHSRAANAAELEVNHHTRALHALWATGEALSRLPQPARKDSTGCLPVVAVLPCICDRPKF